MDRTSERYTLCGAKREDMDTLKSIACGGFNNLDDNVQEFLKRRGALEDEVIIIKERGGRGYVVVEEEILADILYVAAVYNVASGKMTLAEVEECLKAMVEK